MSYKGKAQSETQEANAYWLKGYALQREAGYFRSRRYHDDDLRRCHGHGLTYISMTSRKTPHTTRRVFEGITRGRNQHSVLLTSITYLGLAQHTDYNPGIPYT